LPDKDLRGTAVIELADSEVDGCPWEGLNSTVMLSLGFPLLILSPAGSWAQTLSWFNRAGCQVPTKAAPSIALLNWKGEKMQQQARGLR